MVRNEEEIRRIRGNYQQKSEDFGNAVAGLSQAANAATDIERRSELTQRLKTMMNSSQPALYENVMKNCDQMLENSEAYPDMEVGYNPQPASYTLAGKPKTTKILNSIFPTLYKISTEPSEFITPQGQSIKPCFGTDKGGRLVTSELAKSNRKADLRNVPIQEYTDDDSISHCDGINCRDCHDCEEHKNLVYESLKGLAKGPSGTKHLHLKNLITAIDGWSVHQDGRGGDRATQDDSAYQPCRLRHETLGSAFRLMAKALRSAYQSEGGRHKDKFPGRGNSEAMY
jgi:hypothetical protein